MSIAQLEVLYNGQQIRTVREHALSFPSFTVGGAPTGAASQAAPAGTTDTGENIKKATDAIRGILGNRGKK